MSELKYKTPGPWDDEPDADDFEACGLACFVDGQEMAVADFEKADGLRVGGFLDLQHTAIKTLPENLSVAGSLKLRRTCEGVDHLADGFGGGKFRITVENQLYKDFLGRN